MKHAIFAIALLAFGCGAQPDRPALEIPAAVMDADGFMVVHADPAVLFAGTELDNGLRFRIDDLGNGNEQLMPDPTDPDRGPSSGDLGTSHEAFKVCVPGGPGFELSNLHAVNSDNVPDIIGPCYEDMPGPVQTARKCVFPVWGTTFNVSYKFDAQVDAANCTAGVAGSGVAGPSLIGDLQFGHAFSEWKRVSAIPFVSTTGVPNITIGCAPPAQQSAFPNAFASGGPWGQVAQGPTPIPVLDPATLEHTRPPGFNYPITSASGPPLFYGAGVMWLNDKKIASFIQSCTSGKNATQIDNMKRTFGYRIALHELGHILGFWHAAAGPMFTNLGCPDMGNGSSVFEVSLPDSYASNEFAYQTGLTGDSSRTPFNQCLAPAELDLTSNPDVIEENQIN